jgi:hypothetical protein
VGGKFWIGAKHSKDIAAAKSPRLQIAFPCLEQLRDSGFDEWLHEETPQRTTMGVNLFTPHFEAEKGKGLARFGSKLYPRMRAPTEITAS